MYLAVPCTVYVLYFAPGQNPRNEPRTCYIPYMSYILPQAKTLGTSRGLATYRIRLIFCRGLSFACSASRCAFAKLKPTILCNNTQVVRAGLLLPFLSSLSLRQVLVFPHACGNNSIGLVPRQYVILLLCTSKARGEAECCIVLETLS